VLTELTGVPSPRGSRAAGPPAVCGQRRHLRELPRLRYPPRLLPAGTPFTPWPAI